MEQNVDSLAELESKAISIAEARQLNIQRQHSCAGALVDLFIQGQDVHQSQVSLAIQIRSWLEERWPYVGSYAAREASYLVESKVVSFVKMLVPGKGAPPAPLITLEMLEDCLSTWSPAAMYTLRQVNAGVSQVRRIAFCAMPFHEDFLDVYLLSVLPAARALGLDVNRLDQTYSFTGITQRIWSGISTADLVIADISGHNPNVMYEVGLAQGMGCKTFLIRDSTTDVPFDIKDSMVLTYERKKLYRLQQDIAERLAQVAI